MYLRPPTHEEYNITKDKPELSIIMPAIHPEKWTNVYNSLVASTSRSFELIIITPNGYDIPPWFWWCTNIKIVKDYGSPVRAHAIGASLAEGKFITWIADDGVIAPLGLETALAQLGKMGGDIKNIVTYKFTENEKVYTDEYYKINFHQDKEGNGIGSEHIPDDYYIFNCCLMHRAYYEELGGIDCSYEGTAMAYTDFAIRAQFDGARVELVDGPPILMCGQFTPGDNRHTHVESAQQTHDEPLYAKTYKSSTWRDNIKINLKLNNWKSAPLAWPRKYEPIIKKRIEHATAYGTDGMYSYHTIGIAMAAKIVKHASAKLATLNEKLSALTKLS